MDEKDAAWRSVSAGLVTMRLVDQWIADGATSRVDAWGVSAVREAIGAIAETTPIRRILTSVLDVLVSSSATDLHALCPRLMAYGQALEYESKWTLAADVYATIVAHAHPVEDAIWRSRPTSSSHSVCARPVSSMRRQKRMARHRSSPTRPTT